MRLLFAFILLFCCLGASSSSPRSKANHRFIVFAHDGTFYKLDPQLREVQWHNELPFKLLSLDIAPEVEPENETKTKKIFIPTIDGDFLYLEHSLYQPQVKQILVPREDVEHLLDICFDSPQGQKYFMYEKLQYFVLNSENGQYRNLEEYLSEKLVFNKSLHSIIIVAKKLLKQLNSHLEVKWSVISSKVALVNVGEFVRDSKLNQEHVHHPKYEFVRVDAKTIEILDQGKKAVFEIQASSSIMNIFSEDASGNGKGFVYRKMVIKKAEHKMLALEGLKTESGQKEIYQEIASAIKEPSTKIESFPESIESSGKKQFSMNSDLDHLQICLKTQKILKEAQQQVQPRLFQKPKISLHPNPTPSQISYIYPQNFSFNPQDLPTLPYSSDKHIRVIVTKQQPFVYIFLIAIIVGGGLLFYRFKVNKLWEQISQMENVTDQNMKKIVAKLGEYENVGKELKKMYQVNWEKVMYRSQSCFVFQGRFLNQNVEVFMLPLKGFDIIDIQHKLNILLNCSHKHMTKLYYYTLNDDSLLIFSEMAPGYKKLTQLDQNLYERLFKEDEEYKNNIKVLMDSVCQLMNSKIEVTCFSEESVMVSDKLEIKINVIPTILMKTNEEEDKKLKDMGTSRLRVDLIRIIHKMGHKGQEFDLLKFEKEKNSEEEQNSFLKDFYDHFLLTEQNPQDLWALKSSEKHPFLWDSKQKLLYVCDFSNYIETCIDEQKISKMETHCRNFQIIPLPWNAILHSTLAKELNSYRKYDVNSTRDLIRLIRNKLSHFHEIPKQTRVFVGKTPEQFVQYFLQKFPKLLSFMYAYATRKKWKLSATH